MARESTVIAFNKLEKTKQDYYKQKAAEQVMRSNGNGNVEDAHLDYYEDEKQQEFGNWLKGLPDRERQDFLSRADKFKTENNGSDMYDFYHNELQEKEGAAHREKQRVADEARLQEALNGGNGAGGADGKKKEPKKGGGLGGILIGVGGGSATQAAYENYSLGNKHNPNITRPDYKTMTENELSKLMGSVPADKRPAPVTAQSKEQLEAGVKNKNIVKIGNDYYNAPDVENIAKNTELNTSTTAAGTPDIKRADATDKHTQAVWGLVKSKLDEDTEFQKRLENTPVDKRADLMNAKAATMKFSMADIKNKTGDGNALVDALMKDWPEEEFTLNEYHKIINIQNAAEGLGQHDLKAVVDHVLHGAKLNLGKNEFDDADKTLEHIKQQSKSGENGKGVNTYAHRDLKSPFAKPLAPAKPEEGNTRAIPYELDGNRALGKYGNITAQDLTALRNGIEIGKVMQEKALYNQARGLTFQQQAFEIDQSGNELINKVKNLPPGTQQLKMGEWRSKILGDQNYSPNAPGLTNEQRLQRAQMLQQTFNGVQARLQQTMFNAEREQALIGMQNNQAAVLAKVGAGEYATNPEAALNVMLANVNANRRHMSVLQYDNAIKTAAAMYQQASERYDASQIIEAANGDFVDGNFSAWAQREAEKRARAIGTAAGWSSFTDESYRRTVEDIKLKLEQNSPGVIPILQQYNEGLLENKNAEVKNLMTNDQKDAAAALSSENAGLLKELYESGGISRDWYNKHSDMFKSETTTVWGTDTVRPVVSAMNIAFNDWARDLDGVETAISPNDIVNQVVASVWDDQGKGGIFTLPKNITREDLTRMAQAQFIHRLAAYRGAENTNAAAFAGRFDSAIKSFGVIVKDNYGTNANYTSILRAAQIGAFEKAREILFAGDGKNFQRSLDSLSSALDKNFATTLFKVTDYSNDAQKAITKVETAVKRAPEDTTTHSAGRSSIITFANNMDKAFDGNNPGGRLAGSVEYDNYYSAMITSAAAEIEKDTGDKVKVLKFGKTELNGKTAIVFRTTDGMFYMYTNPLKTQKIFKEKKQIPRESDHIKGVGAK